MTMKHKFNVGDVVKYVGAEHRDTDGGVVKRIDRGDQDYPYKVVRSEEEDDWDWFAEGELELVTPTDAVSLIKAKRAEIKALQAAAAKQKAAAAKKAKALAGLTKQQRELVLFFQNDKDAFGCQRHNVIETLCTLVGKDISKLV